MGWTPPSKFTVFITFLLMAFGIFILLDQNVILYSPSVLPTISILSGFNSQAHWILIAIIIFFFSWFLFFLGVKFKGM